MNIVTISSREFNQDVSNAKNLTINDPVFITDGGHATHVLLTIEEYHNITDKKASIVELLAMPDTIDFEAPRSNRRLYRPVNLL